MMWLFLPLVYLYTVVHCSLSLQTPLVDDSLSKEDKYLARAEKLMKQTPMIDGHNVYHSRVC